MTVKNEIGVLSVSKELILDERLNSLQEFVNDQIDDDFVSELEYWDAASYELGVDVGEQNAYRFVKKMLDRVLECTNG